MPFFNEGSLLLACFSNGGESVGFRHRFFCNNDAPAGGLGVKEAYMRFVDEAKISVKAGKGGHGCVSFRREKFIPRGGPDGGDGGDGGSVILKADARLLSLYDFRLRRHYEAQNGQPGMGSQCYGKKGENLILHLPVGTLVFAELPEGEQLVADLTDPEAEVVVASGGRGGMGNEHFKTSTNRAPRFAQPGEPGDEFDLRLELKILADVGIIGLPNAGKSTFISRVSAARPKIAAYPFTTLTPNLGVMIDEVDPDVRLVLADIPGLIEGAHEGQGLGHRFLKHVERTRFLLHILSVEDVDDEKPWAGFDLINDELCRFDADLATRTQVEVINKIDLVDEERLAALQARAKADGRDIFFISAQENSGVEDLVAKLWRMRAELDRHEPFIHLKEVEQVEDEEFEDIEVFYVRE
jgi:GTP-binding protein